MVVKESSLTTILKSMPGVPGDAMAAAVYAPSDEFIERYVAAAAMHNNPNAATQDIHGFANAVLMFNRFPAVVEYLPIVAPKYIAYALWEFPKFFGKELPFSSDVVRYIVSSFYDFGFVYSPPFLGPLLGSLLREKVGYSLYDQVMNEYNTYVETGMTPTEMTYVKRHVDLVAYVAQMIEMFDV